MNNNKYFYISDNTQNSTYYGVQVSEKSLYNLIDNMSYKDLAKLHSYIVHLVYTKHSNEYLNSFYRQQENINE